LEGHISIPERLSKYKDVYQLYVIRAKKRDELLNYLQSKEIECRVHYPLPLHLQKAAHNMGHEKGDFPESEKQAEEIITLPAHQFIKPEQIEYMLESICSFYLS
jgi:dTDP-4-amino-4,6-dideoxygalactose transaminase